MPSESTVQITPMTAADWPEVARIYAAGIATGDATFETEVPGWDTWDAGHLAHSRLVARGDGGIAGWAALAPVSDRCVYAGVAENSLYVDPAARGTGVGTRLLRALLEDAERNGLWTVQTGIFPENVASLAVHERCGFRVVGTRHHVARHEGGERPRWRDVLSLEYRSTTVGTD